MNQVELTPEECAQIVGELEIVRRKQNQKIQELFNQIDEMSKEIDRLREENGRLVQAGSNE